MRNQLGHGRGLGFTVRYHDVLVGWPGGWHWVGLISEACQGPRLHALTPHDIVLIDATSAASISMAPIARPMTVDAFDLSLISARTLLFS